MPLSQIDVNLVIEDKIIKSDRLDADKPDSVKLLRKDDAIGSENDVKRTSKTTDFGSKFNFDDFTFENFGSTEIPFDVSDTKSKMNDKKLVFSSSATDLDSRLKSIGNWDTVKDDDFNFDDFDINSSLSNTSDIPKPYVKANPDTFILTQPAIKIQPVFTPDTVPSIGKYSVEAVNSIKHAQVNNFSRFLDDYTLTLMDFINAENNSPDDKKKMSSLEHELVEIKARMDKLQHDNLSLKKQVAILTTNLQQSNDELTRTNAYAMAKEDENAELVKICADVLSKIGL